MAYVVNANDASTPTNAQGATQGAEELRALKTKIASVVAGAIVVSAAGANQADLTSFIQPDINDRPAIVAGGWLPWNLNQQWGGAPMPFHLVDSATDVEYKFDAFDAFIETYASTSQEFNFGDLAGSAMRAQGITPAKNLSLQAIWVRLYKVGNPVDNVTLKLWSVAAGVPNAVIATANVINGKQITALQTAQPFQVGQWYRFSFAAVQALVGGTQYMVSLEKSGGVDAANYYRWKGIQPTRNPSNLFANGTAAPVWTAANTASGNFIAEAQASDQVVLSAGTFNGRIVGNEGTPINHSVGFIRPLKEFFPLFHQNGWSILIRGKSFTKDKTFAEILYGLHHDRINIRAATGTGFTTVTVYENDNTVTTVTGTSDISSAGFKDILIVGRSLNDGADYIKIYTGINNVWTKEAESLALSLGFDPLMLVQGHMWLLGGFQLFNNTNYTKLSEMGVLPSADGWTFTTTAATVEGNVFAIAGGKLSQISSGMAAAGDGFYRKAAAALSNANGWLTSAKLRVSYGSNTRDQLAVGIDIEDGTKRHATSLMEYFLEKFDGAWRTTGIPQNDFKTNDSTVLIAGKGSDSLTFVNGRLIEDGTGLMTGASANNQISWGDESVTANENADAIWDYIGYYNTANIYPQFSSAELHEFAVWSGDKNLLGGTLYNLGVPYSIKQYCGVNRNYAGNSVIQKALLVGVTSSPTSTDVNANTVLTDLEYYTVGNYVEATSSYSGNNSVTTNRNYISLRVDNDNPNGPTGNASLRYMIATEYMIFSTQLTKKLNFGLHKITTTFGATAGTATVAINRSMKLESGVLNG